MGSKVVYHFPVNYAGERRIEEVIVEGFADTKAAIAEAFKRVRVIANIRLKPDEVAVIGEPELTMELPMSDATIF